MKRNKLIFIIIFSAVLCTAQVETKHVGDKMEIKITSGAFNEGEFIPKKYTCDGVNISPPLDWSGIPDNTKSIALICDDPDAPMGTWVHWVIFNIPPSINKLKENIPAVKVLEDGTIQGINDFRKTGYGGPCPPGGTHRYYFKIYALDKKLSITSSTTKKDLEQSMREHIVAEGKIVGKYSR